MTERSVTAEGMQRVLFELLTTQTRRNSLSLPFFFICKATLAASSGTPGRTQVLIVLVQDSGDFSLLGMFPYTRVKLWAGDFTQSSSVRLRRRGLHPAYEVEQS